MTPNIVLKNALKKLPEQVRSVLIQFTQHYQNAGWECFLVGGSCRDLILGETPKDFDFATNCPLEKSKKLFKKVIPTGESHGTLTILFKGLQFEVTRYRKDVETDGRRAVVCFSDSIEEDLKRRDLRVNAIAYDVLNGKVIDSEHGLLDFENRMIQFVGNATERVAEDHLRAIRYIRFIAKLSKYNFEYDPAEMKDVIQVFDDNFLAIERVYDEFHKMFKIKNRDNSFLTTYLDHLHLFRNFIPVAEQAKNVIRGMLKTESFLPLAFAYGKNKSVKEVVVDLKLTRPIKRLLPVLLRFQTLKAKNFTEVKRFLNQVQLEDFKAHQKAVDWIIGDSVSETVQTIVQKKLPYRISDLEISGKDLKAMGISGKKIGEVFLYLLENVWESPKLNSHLKLMQMTEDFMLFSGDPAHPPKTPNTGDLSM